jgi:hypothetical protein
LLDFPWRQLSRLSIASMKTRPIQAVRARLKNRETADFWGRADGFPELNYTPKFFDRSRKYRWQYHSHTSLRLEIAFF